MIPALDASSQQKFDKALFPYTYTVKESGKKSTTVIIRAPNEDRSRVKLDVETKLKKAGLDYEQSRSGGSTGSTDVDFDAHIVKITYKPASGGMSETTLNSTITELCPSIAFMSGFKSNKVTTVEQLYKIISESKNTSVYVTANDAKAGAEFISSMPSSSKFKEKMENALAILKFLTEKDKESPIQQIYWGYRSKPEGVSASHKGDIFIRFVNKTMLGVSLKAGGEKTAEPQLNTYVNKMYEDFGGSESDKQALIKQVYNNIHATIGLPVDWAERNQKAKSIEKIQKYKRKSSTKYEQLYDSMLEIIRTGIIKLVNKDKNASLNYIKKQILKKDQAVPLVVVKAFGNSYKFVTDENALETFIPSVTAVKAYKSSSSKQNWHIDLISKTKVITMNMTVRSNKTEPENKVAQGYNLAIKFNGITKK